MRDYQNNKIVKIKKYLKKFSKRKYLPKDNSIFFFGTHTKSVGYYLLNKILNLFKKYFFLNISSIIGDIWNGSNYHGKIIIPKNLKKDFTKMIVTWGFKKDFDKKGLFYDKYFNTKSSHKKKILWFIIYMEDQLPDIINPNIVIFKVLGSKFFNLHNWIKFIFFNLKKINYSIDYFLVNISSFNYLSYLISKNSNYILSKKFDEVIMPYEGQPFQHEIIRILKKKNKNILSTGYFHSAPTAFPVGWMYRKYSPDRIFLTSNDQKNCFENILGWPKKKIKIIPSIRFKKSFYIDKNKIYLPIIIKNKKNIISRIENIHKNICSLKKFDVQNHPAKKESRSHIILQKKIKKLIHLTNSKKEAKFDFICIGNTSSVAELLERGYRVLHICEVPEIEAYSEKIWKSIKAQKLSENIYSYQLRKKGNLIKFAKKNADLDTILEY